MKIIKPSAEIITPIDVLATLLHIERCGRVCYKSEDKSVPESMHAFVRNIIKRGHESVLEHINVTSKFVVDRGISHEIVRHRLCSYSQESTRYCNYSNGNFGNEITVIKPLFFDEGTVGYERWRTACEDAETAYFDLLNYGCSPQEARNVLPTSLKTELVMTANLREWRYFFKLRTANSAHPQMREVTTPLLKSMSEMLPGVFSDIIMESN